MSIVQKVEFDAAIRAANPLEVVEICRREVDRIYRESGSLGGRKWAFSQLRAGYPIGEPPPPRGATVDRERYAMDVATAVMRLAGKVDPSALKAMVVQAVLRLDARDASTYKAESRDAVVKDLDPTRGRRAIVDVDAYVTTGEALLSGRSYLDRILGICAMTGRRTVEVGTSAVFDLAGPNRLGFVGQAKTRDRGDSPRYEIPVLCDASRVLSALATIRADKPELVEHPELFHNRCAKDLHKRAVVFAPAFSDQTAKPKDLRSAYAELAWLLFDERRTGKALFLSRILGHGEDDLLTAQSYDDFTITDPEHVG
jgi:hypothetical protein